MKTADIIIRYSIFAVIAAVIFILLNPIWKYCFAWGESMYFPYLPQKFFDIFFVDPHGWTLLSLVEVCANRFMPQLLGIHHQDYIAHYNIYFLFIVYLGFLATLLFQFEKYIKNKVFSILALIVIFPVTYVMQRHAGGLWWMNHDIWFYSYNMNPIFPLILFALWEKYYVTGQTEFSVKEKILNGILLFLTATGHEFFRITLLTAVPIIFIENNLFFAEKFSKKKFVKFYTILIMLNMMLCLFGDFRIWLEERMRTGSECLSILIPYLKEYSISVLYNNLLFFILIFIMAVSVYYFSKKSRQCKKLLTVNAALIVSVLIFNIIIISGVEDYEYAFEHPGIQFLTKTVLLSVFLSLTGYFLSLKISPKIKIIYAFILLCGLYPYTYYGIKYSEFGKYCQENKEFRQKMYIAEKIFAESGLKEKTLYIPDIDGMPDFIITEYLYNYDRTDNAEEKAKEYKIIRTEDSIDALKDLYKEKTGEEITDDELEKCNFTAVLNSVKNQQK